MSTALLQKQTPIDPLALQDYSAFGENDIVRVDPKDLHFHITKLNSPMSLKFYIKSRHGNKIRFSVLPPNTQFFKITYTKSV